MAESKIVKPKNNWVEIWTNPNPSSTFANNQVVNVDLTNCTELCFELRVVTGSTTKYYSSLPVTSGEVNTIVSVFGLTAFQRVGVIINTDTNTIDLGVGALIQPYGTRVESTEYAVPLRILAR